MKPSNDARRQERSRQRAQLMKELQKGNADACRMLFDDIGPSVTYFLQRRLSGMSELEDIYQEVLMAVFEARHSYAPERPFEPWLFAIARNTAIDYSRRRWTRARWEELVADPPEQSSDQSSVEAPDLVALLAEISPDQREAFAMLKLEGLSLGAASLKSGIAIGTLKVRAHRAYKALRRLLGE